MKKMYLCTVMLLLIVLQSYSQDVLHIKKYDEAGKLISVITLEDKEVAKYDLEQLVSDFDTEGRMTIYGNYMTGDIKNSVFYDSNNQAGTCKNVKLALRPTLGVGGCSNKDFTGFIIKEVSKNSPADRLGLIKGDVISYLNDQPITSYCDLHIAVRGTKVGDVVDLEYRKNGKVLIDEVTMAGKAYKTITFGECNLEKEDIDLNQEQADLAYTTNLSIYPNPSKELTYLKYDSDSNEPLTYYVMDSNGALLYQEHVESFHGSLRTSYSFDGQAPGMYFFVVQQGELSTESKVMYIGS